MLERLFLGTKMKHSVVAIIQIDQKILLGKKVKKEGHFLSEAWHIPGGKVRENESLEQALKREMKEETNLDIIVDNKLVSVPNDDKNLTIHWYLGHAVGNEFLAGGDLSEIKLVSKPDVEKECDERAKALWPSEVLAFLKAE